MNLQDVVEAAEAAVIAAGGKAGSLNNSGRTAQVIQATIVYTGLREIAESLDPLLEKLEEIRIAVYRAR